MANDRNEEYESHDEGEYHFSDDQGNYDEPDIETPKVAAKPAPVSLKETVIAKFTQYRRMIISVVVFFVLIFIVYKMLMPSSNVPTTEFTPNTVQTKPATAKSPKPLVPMTETGAAASGSQSQLQPQSSAQLPQYQPPVLPAQQPLVQQAPTPPPVAAANPNPSPMEQLGMPAVPTSTPPAMSNPSGAPTGTSPPSSMPGGPGASMPSSEMPQGTPQEQAMTQAPAPTTSSVVVTTSPDVAAQNKMIMDRMAALEEQNAKLMSLMQSQYAQKAAEAQAKNNVTDEKVNIVSRRLANVETSMNKMAQIMQDEGFATKAPSAVGAPGIPTAKTVEPKSAYTVQAIIPGRAWLKSDSGDTVTVAEGDMLKDYGRITKIDPYDGIVQIDTGSRVLSLSYGAGGD